jgi:hypothetical protein
LVEVLGKEWQELDRGVMGELLTRVYLRTFLIENQAEAAAEGWGGDIYTLLKDDQGRRLMVMRYIWDTERDADEFLHAYDSMQENSQGRWQLVETCADKRVWQGDGIFVSLAAVGGRSDNLVIIAPDRPIVEAVLKAVSSIPPLAEFTIACGVTKANSDTTTPGKPAIGFDGTNYLVVSCRDIGSLTGMLGMIVSGSGVVLNTFQISQINQVFGCKPLVAFDGTNYLVIFNRQDERGNAQIVGTRVSPSGMVLDGPSGSSVSTGSVSSTSVAFDGVNYLVVGQKFVNNNNYDIYGARITPSGQVLNVFPIFSAPGEQVEASVAFDGANYFVVWRDTRSGSGPTQDTHIFGTRVTPGETVLDPSGIPISTAHGVKGSPHVIFDGLNYFAVWVDQRNSPGNLPPRSDIYGTRIMPNGTLIDGPSDTGGIAINTAPFPKGAPRAGFDATDYLVVWEASFSYNAPAGIYAARVSREGFLVDGPSSGEGISISKPSCDSCRLVSPDILFNGETFLIVWVNNTELSGTTKDVVSRVVSGIPIQ